VERQLPPGSEQSLTILDFLWPTGVSPMEGLRFWGAFLLPPNAELLDYDMIEWAVG
jgi:hypothetical protein